VASCFYGVGLGAKGKHLDSSGAQVTVTKDGSVQVSIGMTEMGQGAETVMTQIASEALGCKPEAIAVMPAETSVVPDSGPTVASRTTLLSGNAVSDACSRIAEVMLPIAADLLGTDERYVRASDGYFATDDPHEVRVLFQDVAREVSRRGLSLTADGWYQPPDTSFDENGQGDAYYVYSFATQIAKVSVDTDTGRVRILKLVAAHDVGKAINPATTKGQIEGGVMIGAGLALYEDFRLADGAVETCDFATYIIPTSMDSFEIVPVVVEHPWPEGPYGAKGFAETPSIPTAAALANAIEHATGVRMTSLPMTPEKVYRAFKDNK
jgi:CO/xanthine dehydrogenase Mo-binding subunit